MKAYQWKPSPKSKFAGVGKTRITSNILKKTDFALANKKTEVRKPKGQIIDELVERFIDQIEPRKNQFSGSGTPKEVIDRLGIQCQNCGATASEVELHVDHIAPVSLFPDLASDEGNLQILCKYCNLQKGNKYIRDYR